MSTLLPQDLDNNPIPALRLKDNGAQSVAVSAVTAKNATAFDAETRVISLYADVAVFVAFGDASVSASASDHYIPSGLYYDVAIGSSRVGHNPYIAALSVDGSAGTLYISEKE